MDVMTLKYTIMKIHSLRWIQKYNSSDASYKHFDFSSDKQRLLKLQHLKDKSVTYNATNDETACICSNFRSLGLHCELSTVLTVVKKKKKKRMLTICAQFQTVP